MALVINKNRCPQNHSCPLLNICPEGAISKEGYILYRIDFTKSTECVKLRYVGSL